MSTGHDLTLDENRLTAAGHTVEVTSARRVAREATGLNARRASRWWRSCIRGSACVEAGTAIETGTRIARSARRAFWRQGAATNAELTWTAVVEAAHDGRARTTRIAVVKPKGAENQVGSVRATPTLARDVTR